MAHEGTGTATDGASGPTDDFYAVLGVRDDASLAEIKSAFRSRARTWHPDAGGDAARFALLREAYETLSDPYLRAVYDGEDDADGTDDADCGADSDEDTRDGSPGGRGQEPLRPDDPHDPMPPGRARARARAFGDDPSFRPPRVRVDPETLDWWHVADADRRLRLTPEKAPGHAAPVTLLVVAVLGAAALLTLAPAAAGVPAAAAVVALAAGLVVLVCRRRTDALRAASDAVRDVVHGSPGSEDDQIAERRTADLLARYVTRLPGARIFHGLAWPGSVFADIDHAVLCGHRLLLVESKRWLPGHYSTAPDAGGEPVLHRNGRRFGGGGSRLAEALDVFAELLPGIEVRGALVLYPNRAGRITVDEPDPRPFETDDPDDIAVLTPEGFLTDACAWLAAEPSTVDVHAFRTVLAQVVG